MRGRREALRLLIGEDGVEVRDLESYVFVVPDHSDDFALEVLEDYPEVAEDLANAVILGEVLALLANDLALLKWVVLALSESDEAIQNSSWVHDDYRSIVRLSGFVDRIYENPDWDLRVNSSPETSGRLGLDES